VSPKDYAAAVRDRLNKKFGVGTAINIGDKGASKSEVTEFISTGIDVVDRYVIGAGGLPVKQMVEVFGDEGTAKTSFALSCCANAIRLGGIAVYCDTEHSLQQERANTFGIEDLDRFIFLQPRTIEEAIDQMYEAALSIPDGTGPNIVAWDSLAASASKEELDGEAAGALMAGNAKLIHRFCKKLHSVSIEKRLALLVVNQTRDNIGVMFGSKVTTPGGKGTKFTSMVRLYLTQGDKPERDHRDVKFTAKKNKLCAEQMREGVARLNYAGGWENVWSTIRLAKELELIKDNARGEKAYLEAIEKLGWKDVVTRTRLGGKNGDEEVS
jgi:recombination protein RecA